VATSTETVMAMQSVQPKRELHLPLLYRILYNHYKHFWARWWMGVPTDICLKAMWIVTCEIAFNAAGYVAPEYDDEV